MTVIMFDFNMGGISNSHKLPQSS